MTTISTLKSSLPMFNRDLIGFDTFFDDLHRLSTRANDNFPRHNVIKHNEYEYTIEIAVAGYSKDELDAEIKDGLLIVTGSKKDEKDEKYYIHKGITTKSFKKEFKLSEHMFVKDAGLTDGILWIDCKVELPEEKKPRKLLLK